MGYTIVDPLTKKCLPIRLIMDHQPGEPAFPIFQVGASFEAEWLCDPCAGSAQRYWIKFESGSEQYLPWFMVIEPNDGERDVAVKLKHYAAVKLARFALERARDEYRRLNGFDADPHATKIFREVAPC